MHDYTIKIVGVICNTTTMGKMGYFCMCESRLARHRVDLHKKVQEDLDFHLIGRCEGFGN